MCFNNGVGIISINALLWDNHQMSLRAWECIGNLHLRPLQALGCDVVTFDLNEKLTKCKMQSL